MDTCWEKGSADLQKTVKEPEVMYLWFGQVCPKDNRKRFLLCSQFNCFLNWICFCLCTSAPRKCVGERIYVRELLSPYLEAVQSNLPDITRAGALNLPRPALNTTPSTGESPSNSLLLSLSQSYNEPVVWTDLQTLQWKREQQIILIEMPLLFIWWTPSFFLPPLSIMFPLMLPPSALKRKVICSR